MLFLLLIILGAISLLRIKNSVLPDVDIPRLLVEIHYPGNSAESIEKTVIDPLRKQFVQINGLEHIETQSNREWGRITIHLDYDTDISRAFYDANEKMEKALPLLPPDVPRPNITMINTYDLPSFYMEITSKETNNINEKDLYAHAAEFKLALEQLPEISFADLTGINDYNIIINTDYAKMQAYQITTDDIINALNHNESFFEKIEFNHNTISIGLENKNPNIDELNQILLNNSKHSRGVRLKDIAKISMDPVSFQGEFLVKGKPAVSLAVFLSDGIKHNKAYERINKYLESYLYNNPDLDINISRNQLKLLSVTLNNLYITLILSIIIVFLIVLIFLRDLKISLIITLCVPISLLISFFFFRLFDIGINIISLSGMILAVGIMIDNSVIVIDSIKTSDYKGNNREKIITGVEQIAKPLLSSAISNCIIFLPMILMGGIIGALVFEQAVSVSISIIVSYFLSITLLPLLYIISSKNKPIKKENFNNTFYKIYEGSLLKMLFKPRLLIGIVVFLLLSGMITIKIIEKKRLPQIKSNDFIVNIEFESGSKEQNKKCISDLVNAIKNPSVYTSTYIGKQSFIVANEKNITGQEALIYVKCNKNQTILDIKKAINNILSTKKNVKYHFSNVKNAFTTVFPDIKNNIYLKIPLHADENYKTADSIKNIAVQYFPHKIKNEILPYHRSFDAQINPQKLSAYNIDKQTVINKLKELTKMRKAGRIFRNNKALDIILANQTTPHLFSFNNIFLRNNQNKHIRLSTIASFKEKQEYIRIKGDEYGPYLALNLKDHNKFRQIRSTLEEKLQRTIKLDGNYFKNKLLFRNALMIILLSAAMLYFVLAIQFESLFIPLLILIELPISIGIAVLCLFLMGNSINILSIIGIMIMLGITINDSIIKIDAIKKEKRDYILGAVILGGRKKLRSIVMTTLTTILAVLPILFMNDLGSDLQKPIAIALTGGLIAGTFQSLFLVPTLFYNLFRKQTS